MKSSNNPSCISPKKTVVIKRAINFSSLCFSGWVINKFNTIKNKFK